MIRLSSNKRGIIYAAIATLCFYLVIDADNFSTFLTAVIINAFLVLIEIYSLRITSLTKLHQLDLPIVNTYPKYLEYFYHFFIPNLLLLSFSVFVYFNPITYFIPFVLLIIFLAYSMLFINLRAYLEDKFQIEISTHFIYAFTLFFAFFSLTNATLNLTRLYSVPIVLTSIILLAFYILIYSGMFIEQLDLNKKLLMLVGFSSIILAGISSLLLLEYSSTLRTSFITTTIFYFSVAVSHHKSEGTLSLGVILEYAIVIALSFTMLYGIQ